MSGERAMRDWYAPLEIYTLRSWLRAAFIVNLILLSFDFLRGEGLVLSLLGILMLGLLVNTLPDGSASWRRASRRSASKRAEGAAALSLRSFVRGEGLVPSPAFRLEAKK